MGCQYYHWYRDLRRLSADELARMGLVLESGGGHNAGTGYGCFPVTRWPEASLTLWWTWHLVWQVLGCPRRHVGRGRRRQARADRGRPGSQGCDWCENLIASECDLCERRACGRHLISLMEEDACKRAGPDDTKLCQDCLGKTFLKERKRTKVEFGNLGTSKMYARRIQIQFPVNTNTSKNEDCIPCAKKHKY